MNNEDQKSGEHELQPPSLPQGLTLFWNRALQVANWCWRRFLGLARAGLSACYAAWNQERVVQARAASASQARNLLGLVRNALPQARRLTRQIVLLASLLLFVAGSILFGGRLCLHTIEPGSLGVRTSNWGGGGVQPEDFGAGLHFNLPGVHKWHSLPAGTQFLSWPATDSESSAVALDVRTLDGTSVLMGVRIPYRIQPGSAHRIVAEGHRNTFESRARAKAEQVLLNELGRLRTEELSRSELRSQVLEEALAKLNVSLDEIHLVAEQILVTSVGFSPGYEKKLVETQRERQRGRVLVARQLEDQEQQTILRRRSEIDRELLERRIELDREIEDVRTQAQALAVEKVRVVAQLENDLRADAERESSLLISKGDAALQRAQDRERRLHGEILSGTGGDEYLALETARAMHFADVTLDANDPRVPSPLDVTGMLQLFGVEL